MGLCRLECGLNNEFRIQNDSGRADDKPQDGQSGLRGRRVICTGSFALPSARFPERMSGSEKQVEPELPGHLAGRPLDEWNASD